MRVKKTYTQRKAGFKNKIIALGIITIIGLIWISAFYYIKSSSTQMVNLDFSQKIKERK
ncbi:hypothetical protein ABSA28_00697 [Candidatus Hepatincolaceae symbiont of Richtersius coronifer]